VITWGNWRQALRVIAHGPHLRRTALVAAVVGTILFAINHLDEVLRGQATRVIWLKGAVTYLVPFCVSNIGVLVGTRRRRERSRPDQEKEFKPSREGGGYESSRIE